MVCLVVLTVTVGSVTCGDVVVLVVAAGGVPQSPPQLCVERSGGHVEGHGE